MSCTGITLPDRPSMSPAVALCSSHRLEALLHPQFLSCPATADAVATFWSLTPGNQLFGLALLICSCTAPTKQMVPASESLCLRFLTHDSLTTLFGPPLPPPPPSRGAPRLFSCGPTDAGQTNLGLTVCVVTIVQVAQLGHGMQGSD